MWYSNTEIGFKQKRKKRKYKSKTSWEDSWYGGYSRIIMDYPELSIDWKLEWKFDTNAVNPLQFYHYQKLIKMFLYELQQHKLSKAFAEKFVLKEVESFMGPPKNILESTPQTVSLFVGAILERKGELLNLFEHYKDVITSTIFSYEIPPPQEEKGGGKKEENEEENKEENGGEGEKNGDGEGDDENENQNDSDGENKPNDQHEKELGDSLIKARHEIEYILENIVKMKPWNYQDSIASLKAEFTQVADNATPIQYTPEEDLHASKLINLLDISFDPDRDNVHNLKMGKLDPAKIAEVPAGNLNVHYIPVENQKTKPFSVCILGDESGSMEGQKIQMQRRLLKILYRTFSQILPEDKIYVYGHTGQNSPIIKVYNDPFNLKFEERIDGMGGRMEYNFDGPVIEAIYKQIRSTSDDNILMLMLSDGAPNGPGGSYGGPKDLEDMKKIIEKCKRDGFVTVGIGILQHAVADLYHYKTVVKNLDADLVKKTSFIINKAVKTEFQS